MTLWPENIPKYWTVVATAGFNSFVSDSNNYFIGLTTILLSFQYVEVILSWVWRDSVWFYLTFEFVLKIRWNAKDLENAKDQASLAKWLSVRLRTKWLWVRVQLQSLKSDKMSYRN